MKTRNYLVKLLLVSLVIITSCSNDDDSTEIISSGSIVGRVALFDDNQNNIDNSGMQITAVGTDPLITTLSGTDGIYALKNLPFGNYTLLFEKEGFGSFKKYDVPLNNNENNLNIVEDINLGQISNSEITALSAVINGNFIVLSVSRNQTEDLLVKRMRIFYGKNSDVSNTNYFEFSPVIGTSGNPASLTFSISFFSSLGFESGETLWFRVYGENFYSNTYEDPDTGLTIFPTINPITLDAVSILIP